MSDKTDARLCWFIAIGNQHNWGRAETEAAAVANMKRQSSSRKTNEYVVYRCTEGTYVNDMGGLNYPTVDGQPEPVKIKHLLNGKPKQVAA